MSRRERRQELRWQAEQVQHQVEHMESEAPQLLQQVQQLQLEIQRHADGANLKQEAEQLNQKTEQIKQEVHEARRQVVALSGQAARAWRKNSQLQMMQALRQHYQYANQLVTQIHELKEAARQLHELAASTEPHPHIVQRLHNLVTKTTESLHLSNNLGKEIRDSVSTLGILWVGASAIFSPVLPPAPSPVPPVNPTGQTELVVPPVETDRGGMLETGDTSESILRELARQREAGEITEEQYQALLDAHGFR